MPYNKINKLQNSMHESVKNPDTQYKQSIIDRYVSIALIRITGKLPFKMIYAPMAGDDAIPVVGASGCHRQNVRGAETDHPAGFRETNLHGLLILGC